jgi:hypothetical protein
MGGGSIPHLGRKILNLNGPRSENDSGETYAQMLLAMNGTYCYLQP